MRIEIWSDVVCPWCYLGKRRLEKAIGAFDHADEIELEWHSFQLDPAFPAGTATPVYEALAPKMGGTPQQVKSMVQQVVDLAAEEGLAYDFDNAKVVNTFDLHRLTHLAKKHGLGGEMHERFMRAYLIEGKVLSDADTLVALASEVGIDAEETQRVLAGNDYADDVASDINEARMLGATGVPFFVLDRAYGVSGAQSVDVFLQALNKAYVKVES